MINYIKKSLPKASFFEKIPLYLPIYRLLPAFLKQFVSIAEMFTAKEAIIRTKWARVHGLEYIMPSVRDKSLLGSRVGSPEEEDHGSLLFVEKLYHPVGKDLPAFALVTVRLMGSYGKDTV